MRVLLIRPLEATEISFTLFDPMPGSSKKDQSIELGLVSEHPDWNDFLFWPDAHSIRDINRVEFLEYAEAIAKGLFTRNNSFKVKCKRNKRRFMTMLRNDPQCLIKKSYQVV